MSLITCKTAGLATARPSPGVPCGFRPGRRATAPPETIHAFAGSLVKARTLAAVGSVVPHQPLPFPHMIFIASGAVRVARDGVDLGELRAPASIAAPAFARHLIVTTEPATTLLGIHNVTEGERSDAVDQPRPEII